MSAPRRRFEYRVIWKRQGEKRRQIRVAMLATAERLAKKHRDMESDDDSVVSPLEFCVVEERPVGDWKLYVPVGRAS